MHRPAARLPPLALVIAIALSLVSACSGADDQEDTSSPTVGTTPTAEKPTGAPESGGDLTFGIAAETNSMTPSVGQWAGSAWIVANSIYEPLAARTTDGTTRPYLAESITPNADFTEWSIRTRSGISFHNGEPFDADAVVTNLEFAMQSPLLSAVLERVSSVEAVDSSTVVVTMSSPWSTFSQNLSGPPGYMAAPALLESPDAANGDPIGTGPFAFESRQIDSNIEVVKNPNYWQPGKPYLDSITFEIIPDATSRSAAMEAGDLDAIELTTPDGLSDNLEESDAGRVQVLTNAGYEANEFIVALNTSTPPFDDLLARQVVAAGIDRDELSDTLSGGVWPAAWGNFEPGSPYYLSPEEAGYLPPDRVRAQDLADAYREKYGRDLSFTFMVPADDFNARLGQVVEEQLGEVGVDVTIDRVEQSKSITSVLTGDYEAGFFAMLSSPTLDAGYSFLATTPTPSGISLNVTRLDDPRIRDAMDAARATDDRDEQIEQWAIVQQQMATNLDRIFLYHGRIADAFGNDVHGFTAATFPDTDEHAFGPDVTYPFYVDLWVEQ